MKFISDIVKKEWIFEPSEFFEHFFSFYVGFRDNDGLPVLFNNMRFGYIFKLGDEIISEKEFPPSGTFYVSTDQENLEYIQIFDLVSANYTITLWCENDGERWEQSYEIPIPIPVQPFPSWTYSEEEKRWNPPVMPPDLNGSFLWNEDTQSWTEIIPE